MSVKYYQEKGLLCLLKFYLGNLRDFSDISIGTRRNLLICSPKNSALINRHDERKKITLFKDILQSKVQLQANLVSWMTNAFHLTAVL